MSETQDNAADDSGTGASQTTTRKYGADWVGVDVESMKARRRLHLEHAAAAREAEVERKRQSLELAEELLAESKTLPAGSSTSAAPAVKGAKTKKPLPEPSALVSSLRIENLRSFKGNHDIPLAPLTLVYGPNAAGKSTVLLALKLLMDVVDAGRYDAINAWRTAFKDTGPDVLTTYEEPEPEDPTGYEWRTPLAIGIDFNTRAGQLAQVDLEYTINPVGPIDVHSSSIGIAGDQSIGRKQFVPEDFDGSDEPFHAGNFGASALPRFTVSEALPGSEPTTESKTTDAELFAHPDRKLQSELFELAFHTKHLGPHRGTPGKDYEPTRGAYNSSWFDYYQKPRISGYDQYDLLNQMLAQLEIPYEFEQDHVAAERGRAKSAPMMRDTRSGAPVRLDQVGYGVSQLLPVIDDCIHAAKQLILIEEPELHLHPRLQAKLGNLFATSVARRGNQVIVETHSESILLRVRRLVRAGKIRPSDVAVLYVDNTEEAGANVRRLRLGAQGELLDPWPTGFFDDALADILGITE